MVLPKLMVCTLVDINAGVNSLYVGRYLHGGFPKIPTHLIHWIRCMSLAHLRCICGKGASSEAFRPKLFAPSFSPPRACEIKFQEGLPSISLSPKRM